LARRDLSGAINFAHLEAYTGADPALTEEVLSIFVEQSALWMRLLAPNAPATSWRDAAHTIRGAALGIGAQALAQACGEAEGQAEASTAARAALLDPIQTAFDAVLSDIAAWRHELALRSLKG
jgi:HPt (histidine-containing phosphotransfer) domain-containing protein